MVSVDHGIENGREWRQETGRVGGDHRSSRIFVGEMACFGSMCRVEISYSKLGLG